MNPSNQLLQRTPPLPEHSAPPPAQRTPGSVEPLPSPGALRQRRTLSAEAARNVQAHRRRLMDRLESGRGAPIVIVGPCSIHDESAALEYGQRLFALQQRLGDRVNLVMRAYFEKPRTTVGWKGFLYDPDIDGSDDLHRGLERARALLVQLTALGLPLATEILDPLTAPYLEDCLSWVAIGARTSESQIHRQLASGLPCPVGFKNGTDGSTTIAAQAMESARHPHTHLGIDEDGRASLLRSAGNPHTHLVLRGGASGPNFEAPFVERAAEELRASGLRPQVLIDCSHGNSNKDHKNQPKVARTVMQQLRDAAHRRAGGVDVLGLMIESHLHEGKQSANGPLRPGVSITDACIDFRTTELLLEELALCAGPTS